jgi:undecaprenyl-diphosphatase
LHLREAINSCGLARLAARFDERVDRAFEPLRGRPIPDRILYGASALGEHSAVWLLAAGAKALRPGQERGRRAAARGAIGLSLEWLATNVVIKPLFRRSRPAHAGARPHYLRTPRSSSFPSGHASSSAFATVVLGDNDRLWPAYAALALLIAASRVHVRIHHASDVLAGAAIGAGLGVVARRAAPLAGQAALGGEPHGRRPLSRA